MPNDTSKPLASVTLKSPIKFGTEEYSVLNFNRRLKSRDLFGIRVGGLKFDDYLTIIARATNIPGNILEEMDASDFADACLVVDGFLSNGPAIGPNASAS